jgi:hypothetical protein
MITETGRIARVTRVAFAVHLVVAVIFGLALLIIPMTFGEWFGYPMVADLLPPLRAFGAMLLGFGGLSSVFGLMARRWEQVEYIVRCEVAYLAFQTLVFAISALSGSGPAVANWVFAGLSAVLLALFLASFIMPHE